MRIALCGSAPSSARLAPFKDAGYAKYQQGITQQYPTPPAIGQEWEIWGCSPGFFGVAERATRWFEVHRWEPGCPWLSPQYVEFLKAFKGPVYTGGRTPEIPQHVVYPLDLVEAEFSSYFLSSSLSLMMALAILDIEAVRKRRRELATIGLDEKEPLPGHLVKYLTETDQDDIIGLWGVDMAAHEEYQYQRPGCHFFVLEALRRGIGIYLPPESDLMRPMPVYGICEWDHNYIKMTQRARELNGAAAEIQKGVSEATQRLAGVQGESHMLDYMVKTWTNRFGMEHGIVVRQTPGTGLGGGVTHFDGRPISEQVPPAPPITATDPKVPLVWVQDPVPASTLSSTHAKPAPRSRKRTKGKRRR